MGANKVHGTAELQTERLILRRYRPEDAPVLYKEFGADAAMYQYSGWNPYGTPEMAQNTVRGFIDQYADEYFYGWVARTIFREVQGKKMQCRRLSFWKLPVSTFWIFPGACVSLCVRDI